MATTPRSSSWLAEAYARLRRVLDPGAEADRERLRAVAETVRAVRSEEQVRAQQTLDRLQALEQSVAALGREAATSERQLTRVRRLLGQQRDLTARIARRAVEDHAAIEAERRVTERLARLARSGRPIVVGPWTGEVGFELLYWIPFLQWVREAYPIDPERLLIVSRGGVRAWYGHVAADYADIFDHATPDEFREASRARKKQQHVRPFDRGVVRRIMRARGLTRAHVLHPTLMYSLYKAYWRYSASVKRLEAFARFRPLPPVDPTMTAGLALPEPYTAVRFYFSECFPDTAENRRFASRIVDGLAARGHVVLLNSNLVVDDHRDFAPEHRARVHRLETSMRPEVNLAVQTAAISRATAFVGTYGGYSYLAPLYGVTALAFHSRPAFKQHHLELAHRAFLRLGSARLVPIDAARAELVGDALAGLATTPSLS